MATFFAATSVAVTSPKLGAALRIGDTLLFVVATDVSVDNVTAGPGGTTPTLSLGNGATATYTGFDAAGLHFSYTVQAGHDTGDLVATGLTLNGATVDHAATVGFEAQTTYAVGTTPTSVTSADVNGDGKADLITANAKSSTVSVLLGYGDGTFDSQSTYAVDTNPRSVTTADVNGDGHADLITANTDGNTVSVLLGTGTGTFGAQTKYPVGSHPYSVTTADVNEDGKVDLIASNNTLNYSETVSVLLGNGDGTFDSQTTYAVGEDPYSVTTADVNGDDHADLITINHDSHTVSVLLGTGTGTFGPRMTYAVGIRPYSVTTADVNGDGKVDLITGNNSETVSVLLGNGDGTFELQSTYPYAVDTFSGSVTTADVNGDGKVDLITAATSDSISDTVSALLGNGDGTFASETTYAVGNTPFSVTTADVNGDGRADLITANTHSNTVSVLLNTGTPAASLDAANFTSASGRDTGLAIDTTRPAAGIVVADSTLTVGETSQVTITFSEAVTDFTNADLTAANGVLTAVLSSDGGVTWTATLTPAANLTNSTNLIRLDNTGVSDTAGNAGSGSTTSNNYAIDTVRPTVVAVVVADSTLTVDETSQVTIAFSEAVTGFTNADLTVSNGALTALSSLDGGITWTATLTPAVDVKDANNLIMLDNSGISDTAGNAGTGSTASNNYAIDTAVNDAPVNTVPGSQTVDANTTLAIAGLSVSDVDAGATAITTILSVAHGTLTVASAGGAAVAGSGTASVTLTGTVAQINTTLAVANNVVYAGQHDFFGADVLTMTTNDGGHTGSGGALVDIDQVAITVGTLLTGTPGNDSFTALPGNERIEAGAGTDTVTFGFRLVDATVSYLGKTLVIDGPGGSHTLLTGFEVFNFTDGTVRNDDGSPLVDDLYYYSKYHDVWNAHVAADTHYDAFGWHEGRDPNAFFSTSGFLAVNRDVAAAGINPLDRYHEVGWREGRDPGPNFDTKFYLMHNPDVAAAGVDPLAHYLQFGLAEGRAIHSAIGNPVNGFDAAYYLEHNPDVAAAGIDPLAHFNSFGWHEGRNPNAMFDTNGYLAHYADVANAGINPLAHYEQFGWKEGRDPSAHFDTTGYLAANPDVAAAHVNPLDHYLTFGIYEGRTAINDGFWG